MIQNILSSLNKLTISKEIFQITNIGTILNSLKSLADTSIQAKAASILSRWEKMTVDDEGPYRPREAKVEMNKK
jgi:TFIIS helical bundle-like domain.